MSILSALGNWLSPEKNARLTGRRAFAAAREKVKADLREILMNNEIRGERKRSAAALDLAARVPEMPPGEIVDFVLRHVPADRRQAARGFDLN